MPATTLDRDTTTDNADTGETTETDTSNGLFQQATHSVTPRQWRLTDEEQAVLDAGQNAQLEWELRADRALKARRLPYAVTLATAPIGALAWWIGEVNAHPLIVAPVASAAVLGVTASVRWATRTIVTEAWRRRTWMTGTVSALWAAITTIAPHPGLMLVMVGTLFVLQHVLSRKPRADHPTPDSFGLETLLDVNPAIEAGPDPHTDAFGDEVLNYYAQRWDNFVGAPRRALAGSHLTDGTATRYAVQFTLNLDPGEHSAKTIRSSMDKISSGIGLSKENIFFEPHPEIEDPAVMRMTLVLDSPVRQPRMWQGPSPVGNTDECSVGLGRYADGLGEATWELWRSSGMRNGLIIGGTRSGKGGLSGGLMASARSTGKINTIYVDPQSGMSSRGIALNATVTIVGQEASNRAIEVVEAIAAQRESQGGIDKNASSRKAMFANSKTKFLPSSDQPGWVVLVDECSMIFPEQAEAWGNFVARCLKLGICVIAMTQNTGIASIGGTRLRSALVQNYVALKIESSTEGGLIPGLASDPADLPDTPGYGYIKNADRSGVAFRGDWLPEEDDGKTMSTKPPWMLEEAMEQHPEPAVCDSDRTALMGVIGQPDEDGVWTVTGDESFVDNDDEDDDTGGKSKTAAPPKPSKSRTNTLFNLDNLPPMPTMTFGQPLQLSESDQKVYDAIKAGKTQTKAIVSESGVSRAQVHRILTKLSSHGAIHSPAQGRWKPANSGSESDGQE